MAQERVDAKGGKTTGSPQGIPAVPGITEDVTAFADPKVLAAINCDFKTIAGEAERRTTLLQAVSIDENGVAHCIDTNTGVETLLAAVAINSKRTATLTELKLGPSQELQFPVTTDTPTRFGFFVGHLADGQDVSLAFRMGLYPGLPLVTETRTDTQNREVYIGVRGIKPNEKDEQCWADDIKVFSKLGFKPKTSRGIFARFHRPNSYTDDWKSYALVALPDQMLDLLNHYDPKQLRIDTFQMLFYTTKDETSRPSYSPLSDLYLGCGGHTGATRGGEMLSYGTSSMGVGFGEAESIRSKVTGMEIKDLAGAFGVVFAPK